MHNILLIAKREYLERIRTKGFLVATILIPTLMAGGIFGTAYIADKSKSNSHIAIVSSQHPLPPNARPHRSPERTRARQKQQHGGRRRSTLSRGSQRTRREDPRKIPREGNRRLP